MARRIAVARDPWEYIGQFYAADLGLVCCLGCKGLRYDVATGPSELECMRCDITSPHRPRPLGERLVTYDGLVRSGSLTWSDAAAMENTNSH